MMIRRGHEHGVNFLAHLLEHPPVIGEFLHFGEINARGLFLIAGRPLRFRGPGRQRELPVVHVHERDQPLVRRGGDVEGRAALTTTDHHGGEFRVGRAGRKNGGRAKQAHAGRRARTDGRDF